MRGHERDRQRHDGRSLGDFASRRAALRELGPEGFVRAVLRHAAQAGARELELRRPSVRRLEVAEAQEGGGGV